MCTNTCALLAPAKAACDAGGASVGVHAPLAALLGRHGCVLNRRPGCTCLPGLLPPTQHATIRPSGCSLRTPMRITDPRHC